MPISGIIFYWFVDCCQRRWHLSVQTHFFRAPSTCDSCRVRILSVGPLMRIDRGSRGSENICQAMRRLWAQGFYHWFGSEKWLKASTIVSKWSDPHGSTTCAARGLIYERLWCTKCEWRLRNSHSSHMPTRSPYTGACRKLVLAFDVGTTYSGISYRYSSTSIITSSITFPCSILDPGQVPEIKGITR